MDNHNSENKEKSSLSLYILGILFALSVIMGIFISTKKDKMLSSPSITSRLNTSQFNPFVPSIRVIDINGAIEYTAMVPYVLNRLKKAQEADNVKAVILRINSGGGTVGASQEIYHSILRFKKETKKPVIAVFGDVAASGAYYIACASDYIFSRSGTIAGSIGVIIGGFTFEKMFKQYGIKQEIVKSGKFKDLGSAIGRNRTKEETALFQKIISGVYKQFFNAVLQGRKNKINRETLVKYADGRVFTGESAKKIGLVDNIGGVEEAKTYIKEKLGIEGKVNIIEEGPANILEKLFKANSNISIKDFIKSHYSNIPLYLYSPSID